MIEVGEYEPCATCYTPTNMFSVDEWSYYCDYQCLAAREQKGIFANEGVR